jgi:hypothetical protein
MVKTVVIRMLLLAFCAVCFGDEPERPICNKQNRSRLWPEQANSDPRFAQRAARCGELLICTTGRWKYRWQPVAVHFRQLGNNADRQIPACSEANPDAASEALTIAGKGNADPAAQNPTADSK